MNKFLKKIKKKKIKKKKKNSDEALEGQLAGKCY